MHQLTTCPMRNYTPTHESGYSLIQVAIGMIVLGIMMSSSGYVYSLYIKNRNITETQGRVQEMVSAIQTYRQANGRFPCPAAMNVPRDDASYGHENCTSIVAPGDCANGICVESAIDGTAYTLSSGLNIAAPANRAAALTNARVRVGAIPFRLLQIDERNTYDAYGSRLLYAMTESMAVQTNFDEKAGAIHIVDANGRDLVNPPGSIPFLILSPGPNRVGAYNENGMVYNPCAGVQLDTENCRDFSATGTNAESIYTASFRTDGSTTDNYDDVIEYFAASFDPLWKRTTTDLEDIESLVDDNVGIDLINPTDALQIPQSSVVISGVQQKGALRATVDVQAELLCDENGLNCFDPRRLGGDIVADGISCATPGEYMVGIHGGTNNGEALCDDVRVYCTNDAEPVLKGFDASGAPLCIAKPLAPCADEVQICNSTGVQDIKNSNAAGITNPIMASGAHGQILTLTDSTSYPTTPANAKFQCDNGIWKYVAATYSGICSCVTPATTTRTITTACAGNASATSAAIASQTWNASTCSWDTTSSDFSACVCGAPGTMAPTYTACGSGFNVGTKEQTYVFNNASNKCVWEAGTLNDTCACDPSALVPPTVDGGTTLGPPQSLCPEKKGAGYSGTVREILEFDATPLQCKWNNAGWDTSGCSCDTTTEFPDHTVSTCNLACQTEISPEQWVVKYIVSGTSCIKDDPYMKTAAVCSNLNFFWKSTSGAPVGPPLGNTQGKPEVNEPCTCLQKGSSGTCYQEIPTLPGNYNFFPCTCQ